MKQRSFLILIISLLLLALGVGAIARAQESAPVGVDAPAGTAFTYQGQLKDANGPVTDSCDFQLSLWDAFTGGTQVGSTQTRNGITVSEGLFTVQLDFGANAFNGSARWLETAVRCPAGGGPYNTLSPRQPLTPAPYAINSANADKLDGLHAAAFQQHAHNLLVVAKSGGDYTTITDALNSITDNSESNPYLVYVAPGVYTETVTMKPYVDIEGAGETATKITFTNTDNEITGTVVGAGNAELRFLTVENTGGSNFAYAIYNSCGSDLRLTHLTIIATGGLNNTSGVRIDCGSSPTLTNITAISSGANINNNGVESSYSYPKMSNVIARGSGGTNNYGVRNYHSSFLMTNVIASAVGGTYSYGVFNDSSSPAMMNVNAIASGGSDKNCGVYNDSSSPMMMNVTANASGGNDSYGVWNYNSSPIMTKVSVTASGGTWNRGVINESSSSPTMTDSTATASGGNDSYGVWNDSSSFVIQNSVISASEGIYANDGLHNIATTGSYTIKINNSQITGGTSTIYQDSYYTTMVGASQLAGGGVFGGTYICAASYNGNYAPLNSTCQP